MLNITLYTLHTQIHTIHMYNIHYLFATENSNRYLIKVGQTDRSSKNQTELNSNKKFENQNSLNLKKKMYEPQKKF